MFNEILPRSPHRLYGESMVADFQQEPAPPEQYEKENVSHPYLTKRIQHHLPVEKNVWCLC
jgi:hypothetical protein